MRLNHSTADFADACAEVEELADRLPALENELHRRYQDTRRDGFPQSTLDRSSPATEYDEQRNPDTGEIERVPMPARSDPTARAATASPVDDPDGRALHAAWSAVTAAREQIRKAHGQLAAQLTPAPVMPEELGRDWCWSCARIGKMAPTWRDSAQTPDGVKRPRCRNCYDFARVEQRDPPLGVVRAWADGRRVTSRVIAAALAEERQARQAGRNGRKAS